MLILQLGGIVQPSGRYALPINPTMDNSIKRSGSILLSSKSNVWYKSIAYKVWPVMFADDSLCDRFGRLFGDRALK